MRNLFPAIIISSLLLLAGCAGRNHSNHNDSDHDDHAAVSEVSEVSEENPHSGEIIFTKAQAELTEFQLYTVERSDFSRVITATGQISASQGNEINIVAPVSGIISFGTQKISEGASVNSEDALFYISSRNISEGDYATRISAAYEQAKAAYERNAALVEDRIVSRSDYELSKLAYEQAKAAYDALGSRSTDKGISVKSSMQGFVKSIDVADGQFVEVGQSLGVISQSNRLTLRADVSQQYSNALRNVSSANFRTPFSDKIYSLRDMGGKLLSTGQATDANSAFIPVTFEFDNKGDIVQGAFVEVFLLTTPVNNVITVPVTAIVEEQGIYSVFVQLDEEGYLKREVRIGATNGNTVEILSGLSEGEVIVGRGARQVKSAAASGTIPHGHAH